MAQYHPSDDWLALYASGAADEQTEALIAAHLTYCPACRRAVAQHEEIAGALLEGETTPNAEVVAGVEEILQTTTPTEPSASKAAPQGTLNEIAPRPLVNYVYNNTGVSDVKALKWTYYGPGIKRAIIVGDRDAALVRLVKAEPGSKFPDHDHGSDELTLVLTGAYRDHTGRFAAGDVQCAPAALSHQPVVENEGICFAFVVSEKPAILKKLAARIAQRFVGG